MSFQALSDFENKVAEFFGATYAVATDCCTHAIEMCLQLKFYVHLDIPAKTYISLPFMLEKIRMPYRLVDKHWRDYYYVADDIIDAALHWEKNGYIPKTKMCLSFHFKKHINIGRGGMILLDNKEERDRLVRMRHDGRSIYENKNYNEAKHYFITALELHKKNFGYLQKNSIILNNAIDIFKHEQNMLEECIKAKPKYS